MELFMRPVDKLFFRDGRPFDANSDTLGRGIFPPHPSTIYGAIRSYVLHSSGTDIKDFSAGKASHSVVGTSSKLGSLAMNGNWLTVRSLERKEIEGELHLIPSYRDFFPIPLNMVKPKNGLNQITFLTPSGSMNDFISNFNRQIAFCLPVGDEACEPAKGFIPDFLVKEILKGNQSLTRKDMKKIHQSEVLFQQSYHVGIARNKKRTAQEGMLYSVAFTECSPAVKGYGEYGSAGLHVSIAHGGDPQAFPGDGGYMALGGERHVVEFEKMNKDECIDNVTQNGIADAIFKNKKFFFWLVTPAVFANGFLPDCVSQKTLALNLPLSGGESIEGTLISCQVGKPVHVGGFDLAKKMPKEMVKAVPAGTVYFFSLTDNYPKSSIEKFLQEYQLKTLPTANRFRDYRQQGFGCVLVGAY